MINEKMAELAECLEKINSPNAGRYCAITEPSRAHVLAIKTAEGVRKLGPAQSGAVFCETIGTVCAVLQQEKTEGIKNNA